MRCWSHRLSQRTYRAVYVHSTLDVLVELHLYFTREASVRCACVALSGHERVVVQYVNVNSRAQIRCGQLSYIPRSCTFIVLPMSQSSGIGMHRLIAGRRHFNFKFKYYYYDTPIISCLTYTYLTIDYLCI